MPDGRDVQLTIPAKAGYLVLARLALAAICRLTPLGPEAIADLKLAVTEAAGEFVDEGQTEGQVEGEPNVDFNFHLAPNRLEMRIAGRVSDTPAVEQELSRAIIEATVDECEFEPERIVLVKLIP